MVDSRTLAIITTTDLVLYSFANDFCNLNGFSLLKKQKNEVNATKRRTKKKNVKQF